MIHIENTTIEEQIAYEKDFAKFCLEQAEKWKNKDLDEYGYHMKTYRESTNKYRWLKELKAHREAWEKCIKEIKEWYWNADKQAIAKDPCVVDAMVDLFIRTIKECRPKEGDAE